MLRKLAYIHSNETHRKSDIRQPDLSLNPALKEAYKHKITTVFKNAAKFATLQGDYLFGVDQALDGS